VHSRGNRIDSCRAARHFQLVLWRDQALFVEPTKRQRGYSVLDRSSVRVPQ
jgi:hypothetical protein